jgi:ribonuclease HII
MRPKKKKRLMGQRYQIAAGIDEAGRGPLAGPVVACALVFVPTKSKLSLAKFNLAKLSFPQFKDSKHLSAKQRERYHELFIEHPGIEWGIGKVGERVIDRINIYQATRLAMERAVANLSRKVVPNFLYIDGTMNIDCAIPQKTVVRGDETLKLCAMASIVAKVVRDRIMKRYHEKYPQYGFDRHKGYGTRFHIAKLKELGPCTIHRKTFSPIAS